MISIFIASLVFTKNGELCPLHEFIKSLINGEKEGIRKLKKTRHSELVQFLSVHFFGLKLRVPDVHIKHANQQVNKSVLTSK